MRLFVSHKTRPAPNAESRRGDPPKPAEKVSAEKLERAEAGKPSKVSGPKVRELGGPSGPEPTRYGDWERKGICSDF